MSRCLFFFKKKKKKKKRNTLQIRQFRLYVIFQPLINVVIKWCSSHRTFYFTKLKARNEVRFQIRFSSILHFCSTAETHVWLSLIQLLEYVNGQTLLNFYFYLRSRTPKFCLKSIDIIMQRFLKFLLAYTFMFNLMKCFVISTEYAKSH